MYIYMYIPKFVNKFYFQDRLYWNKCELMTMNNLCKRFTNLFIGLLSCCCNKRLQLCSVVISASSVKLLKIFND